jgi:carbonic anhydrase
MWRTHGQIPRQAPFAVVVGCSDARVPTEMIFGQGFNDLFVIRVAGNVLGDECLGSIDFAVNALSDSVRLVVMLGHSRCGAVTGAVDAYLRPLVFWSKTTSHFLRTIFRRIFVSVREADNGLKEVWGPDARQKPGFREALIDIAVALNAAQSAFDLRLEVERAGKWEIEVFFGVYDTRNHRVSVPVDTAGPIRDRDIFLAPAPSNPRDFSALAIQLARLLQPGEVRSDVPTPTLDPADDRREPVPGGNSEPARP